MFGAASDCAPESHPSVPRTRSSTVRTEPSVPRTWSSTVRTDPSAPRTSSSTPRTASSTARIGFRTSRTASSTPRTRPSTPRTPSREARTGLSSSRTALCAAKSRLCSRRIVPRTRRQPERRPGPRVGRPAALARGAERTPGAGRPGCRNVGPCRRRGAVWPFGASRESSSPVSGHCSARCFAPGMRHRGPRTGRSPLRTGWRASPGSRRPGGVRLAADDPDGRERFAADAMALHAAHRDEPTLAVRVERGSP